MVKIRIDGDTAAFEKKLSDLGSIGEKALNGLKIAAAAAGTALVAIGTLAFNAGKDYESAFAGVEKTVEASAQELAVMRKALIDMSGEIPLAATELAGIAETAGQLGIATGDIVSFTKVMANLGVATNMTAEEAATMLARFANVTGLDPSKYENLGSAVVALGNNFATTESEIVTMAQRMAGAASNAGFAEAEILALATALSSVGIEAQAGGGSMTRVLNQMDKEVKSSGANLEQFAAIAGMSAEEFAAAWGQNAAHAFDLFVQGLGRVQDAGGSVAATLESVGISETIATTALTNLAGAGGLLTSALDTANTAFEENTALATEAATRYKTLESQMQLLENGATAVGITLYDSFRGAAMDAVQGLQTSVAKLNTELSKPDARKAVESIGTAFASLVKTVGNMVTAILPPFIKALGLVADNMDVILPITLGLVAAFKLMSIIGTVTAAMRAMSTATAAAQVLMNASTKGVTAEVAAQSMLTAALGKKATAEVVATTTTAAGLTVTKAGTLITASGTVATAADTAAVLINSGAISAKTVLLGVLNGSISLTTAAQWLWNAAMMANPIGLVVAGAVALTAVLVGLSIALGDNNEELAAATERAKELKSEQESMADSVRDSAAAFESNASSANVQAETASKLVAKIREISTSNEDAAVKSIRLRSAVDQLNQVMPELGLSFNEATGEVIGLTGATDDYIVSLKESAKAELFRERAVELTKEQAEAEIKLAEIQAEMLELETAGLATYEQYVHAAGEYQTRSTEAYAVLQEAAKSYGEVVTQTGKELGELEGAMNSADEASEKSAETFKYSEENLQSLADQYGTTVEAIKAATDGTVASLDTWVAAQDEAAAATAEATQEMAAQVEENLNRVAEAYQTSNDRIDLSNATSLENRINNIAENQRLSNEYAANIAYLGEQVGTELDAGLLAELQRGDAEAMALAQQMVDSLKAGDEKWAELNGYYQNSADTAITTLAEGMTFSGENPGTLMVNEVAEAVVAGSGVIAEAANTAGSGAVEGLQSSIASGAPASIGSNMVTDAASGVSGNPALQSASQATGQDAIISITGAIESGDPVGIGQTMIDDISTGVSNSTPEFISTTETSATDAVEAAKVAASAEVTQPIGVDLITGIQNGVNEMQASLASAAKAATEEAVSAARSAGSAGVTHSIGADMVRGIANGVSAGASGVVNAMVSAVQQAIAAAKAAAQIASPSKIMRREVGEMLGAGLAFGIEDSTKDAVQAAEDQMQDVIDAYEDPGALTLQTRFLAEFGEVPARFFETGRVAGEQFIAGFNLAAMGFMSMLENIIMGRPLMSVSVNENPATVRDVNINFNEPVESPDATARSIKNVFEYGLAGERN